MFVSIIILKKTVDYDNEYVDLFDMAKFKDYLDKVHKLQVKNSQIYRLINANHRYLHSEPGHISDHTTDMFINITNGFIGHKMNLNNPTSVFALQTDV